MTAAWMAFPSFPVAKWCGQLLARSNTWNDEQLEVLPMDMALKKLQLLNELKEK